jgi:threonine aldolase
MKFSISQSNMRTTDLAKNKALLIEEPVCYSDNTSPVHPTIMQALIDANSGRAHAYGRDADSKAMKGLFSQVFERDVDVSIVTTGTAANALALGAVCPPFGSIYVSHHAHTLNDECGAPEMFTAGAKVMPIEDISGKITAHALETCLREAGIGQMKRTQPAAISLAQVTELGTVYSLDELRSLSDVARSYNLRVHMDGARFSNAIAHLRCTPAEMTWKIGVDVLSFGATKGGALAAEAVIFFRKELADAAQYRTKRAGHVLSKMRYISAQWRSYLKDDLWLEIARLSNARARELAEKLESVCGGQIVYPVQANEVFVRFAPVVIDRLLEAGHQVFRSQYDRLRFVTAWDTTSEDIDRHIAAIGSVGGCPLDLQ